MQRRTFLTGLVAGASLLSLPAHTKQRKMAQVFAWLRMSKPKNADAWARYCAELRAAGVTQLIAQVFPSTHAIYGSAILPVKRRELEVLLPAARKEGLPVHAWIHALRCNVPKVMAEHADWYSISRKGESSLTHPPYTQSYRWLCPSRQPVRAFLASIAAELVALDVAGVHLDFIRHPDVFLPLRLARKRGLEALTEALPEYDFCYCAVCRAGFEKAHGADPSTLPGVATNATWESWRVDELTALVSHVKGACGKKTLSAAVFATPSLARHMVRQDWARWPLDAVMPMIYQRGYEQPLGWIESATRDGVSALNGRTPLYSGLLTSTIKPSELPKAIRLARAGGSDGVALFNLGAAGLAALSR